MLSMVASATQRRLRFLITFLRPVALSSVVDATLLQRLTGGAFKFRMRMLAITAAIGTPNLQGGPISATTIAPPPGVPRWGAAYRDFLSKYYARHGALVGQTENLPYSDS